MLVVLWVVARVKCERAPADVAVDVFDVVRAGDVAHDGHGFFDAVFAERRCLSQKPGYDGRVVLREHRGHGIVFGGKFKQGKSVQVRIFDLAHFRGRQVDVRVFVFHRVQHQIEVFKGHCARKVEFLLRHGIRGVPVINAIDNIDPAGREGNVKGIGCRAHGKDKSALRHVVVNGPCNRALELRNFGKAQFACECLKLGLLPPIPELAAVAAIEFAVLPGEVFVVQVQPVVVLELAR